MIVSFVMRLIKCKNDYVVVYFCTAEKYSFALHIQNMKKLYGFVFDLVGISVQNFFEALIYNDVAASIFC